MTPEEWGEQIAFGVRTQVAATETAGVLPRPAFLMLKGHEQRSMVLTEELAEDMIPRLRSMVAVHDPDMVALCLLLMPPEDEPTHYVFVASIQARREPLEFHIEVIELTTDPDVPEPDKVKILEAIGPNNLYDTTGLSAVQLQWGQRALERFVEMEIAPSAVN